MYSSLRSEPLGPHSHRTWPTWFALWPSWMRKHELQWSVKLPLRTRISRVLSKPGSRRADGESPTTSVAMYEHMNHIPFGRKQARGRSFGISLGQAPIKLHACIDASAQAFGVTFSREDAVVRREVEVPAGVNEIASRPARAEAAGESGQKEQESLHLGGCQRPTCEQGGWREERNGEKVG